MENDLMTPRERINESLLRRCALEEAPCALCRGTEKMNSSHSSSRTTWGLTSYPLASMYAPLQEWRNVYETELALSKGTMFRELELPFVCGNKRGGSCNGR